MASVSTPGVWPTAMPLHVNKKNICKRITWKKALKQIMKGHNKGIISPLHGTLLHYRILPLLCQVSKQPVRRDIFSRDTSNTIWLGFFFLFMTWGSVRVQCLAQKHNTMIIQPRPKPGFLIQHATSLTSLKYVLCSMQIVTFLRFLVNWCGHNQLTLCWQL